MKKRIINIFICLLFSLTFLITVFTLTALSKNFVKMVVRKTNYYDIVIKEVNKNKYGIKIDKSYIKKDLNNYIKSRYKNTYIVLPDGIDNKKFREEYNRIIKFDNILTNYDITSIIYLIYFVDIILIIITGIILNKTKGKHDLNNILIFNFIISILIYGIIKIFISVDNFIINEVIKMFNYYYLGIAIILFELSIINKIKTKLK